MSATRGISVDKRFLCVVPALALLILSCSAHASNTYMCEQFANISPMSGGGWAVDPCGEIEGNGAFQVNIPVAYVPKAGSFVGAGYVGGALDDKSSFENKSAVLGASIGGLPRVWLSGMAVSGTTATGNIQVQINQETKSLPAFSGGFQSVFRTDCNRWGFAVATKGFCMGRSPIYVTAGVRANTDNARGIAGISVPINQYLGFAAEYDGLQGNAALIVRPAGLKSPVTLLGGYNGHAGWLAGLSFNLNVTTLGTR